MTTTEPTADADPIAVRLRLLGSTELTDGEDSFPVGDPLQSALLAILALRANNRVGGEALAAALWEDPPRTALRQIQTKVWQLNELLDHAFAGDAPQHRPQLVNHAGGYLLLLEPASIDLVHFDTCVKAARRAAARGEFEDAARSYRDALALWRGPAFEDIRPPEVSAPGIRAEAITLQDHWITVTEERIGTDLVLGRHHEVIAELRALVRTHPLRERCRLHLIRALGRVGERQEAIATYLEGHRILVEEHGLEVSPHLTEAYRVVLARGRSSTGGTAHRVPPPGLPSMPGMVVPAKSSCLPLISARPRRGQESVHVAQVMSGKSGGASSRERGQPGGGTPLTVGTSVPSGTRLLHPYPRGGGRTARPPAHLEPVLEQLLCGATDLTASRRLGLSPRTFSRRVSELLEYLGVATRFQAGAEAYNRGWITVQPGG